MLATPTVELSFDDDDWVATPPAKLYRAASVGNSWGVTIMGRGFDWKKGEAEKENDPLHDGESTYLHESLSLPSDGDRPDWSKGLSTSAPTKAGAPETTKPISSVTPSRPSSPRPRAIASSSFSGEPLSVSPSQSPSSSSPIRSLPLSGNGQFRPPLSRSSSNYRPRRRSSQQRVSLIAGRVSILPVDAPAATEVVSSQLAPQQLIRSGSTRSLLSLASSTRPPTPNNERETLIGGGKSITEFVIEGELGRGAYGLVKRAREMNIDGTLGPPLVIKQVFKSRILADCWKKHPQFGTIPIEIYVMNAISSTSYVLPPRRPWDPARLETGSEKASEQQCCSTNGSTGADSEPDFAVLSEWVEGKVVKGHPNIGPLWDFFEDDNYYYLVMPCLVPAPNPAEPSPPSDLFDLVETYPHGLPPSSVRTYLGQIADALAFLHSKGIVHRDVKDENVVLGPHGRCILIDFGSSGLVKRGGWDTFSGTLDYAGPEILRGERYQGKEQDVWAFGVVAYVLLVGECPFTTAAEAQEGLESPFASATIALDERCGEGKEHEGEEPDGGGALGDAAALVKACLRLEVSARPTFDRILQSRFLNGNGGWGMHDT
ncbi:kinase-like protein [Gloeophyllum trabeum ATCC 11539]|uniref:Kinase-like protein n=1 Tax=Gloeophyllum trabeum (strain ATCC 11539 / FP-39264 / Madison 617) TaxID=670483 RepID=S7QMI4_GLOTA|nr:kinase-like protein [Gloeophyllum trabeum ATCC 11539]EPQ60776.1 kinase-like protein [Gloeophyllum trabeum ATCC 11539]